VWKRHSSYISQLPLLICIFSSVAYSHYAKLDASKAEALAAVTGSKDLV
jgi:hypothetical protein